MLRIGDFSQLAQVSIRTLRLYDEMALFKPAQVDPYSDYRYYAIDQLPRLNRILALKDLGFSLEQIKQLLDEKVSAGQLREMLASKRAEIEQQIAQERVRLARVEARLGQIEREGEAPAYEVVLKKVGIEDIAGVRQLVPRVEEMETYRHGTLGVLYDWLHAHNVRDAETELMLYHNTEYSDENIEMETAVVIPHATARVLAEPGAANASRDAHEPVCIRMLPEVESMATTIHQGALFDIPQAIIAVFDWIGRNNYRSAGPIRELHLFGREYDIQTEAEACQPHIVEVQIPVEPG